MTNLLPLHDHFLTQVSFVVNGNRAVTTTATQAAL